MIELPPTQHDHPSLRLPDPTPALPALPTPRTFEEFGGHFCVDDIASTDNPCTFCGHEMTTHVTQAIPGNTSRAKYLRDAILKLGQEAEYLDRLGSDAAIDLRAEMDEHVRELRELTS